MSHILPVLITMPKKQQYLRLCLIPFNAQSYKSYSRIQEAQSNLHHNPTILTMCSSQYILKHTNLAWIFTALTEFFQCSKDPSQVCVLRDNFVCQELHSCQDGWISILTAMKSPQDRSQCPANESSVQKRLLPKNKPQVGSGTVLSVVGHGSEVQKAPKLVVMR